MGTPIWHFDLAINFNFIKKGTFKDQLIMGKITSQCWSWCAMLEYKLFV